MGLLSQQFGKVIELTAGSTLCTPTIRANSDNASGCVRFGNICVGSENLYNTIQSCTTLHLRAAGNCPICLGDSGSTAVFVSNSLSVSQAGDCQGIAIGCTYTNIGSWHTQLSLYGSNHSVTRWNMGYGSDSADNSQNNCIFAHSGQPFTMCSSGNIRLKPGSGTVCVCGHVCMPVNQYTTYGPNSTWGAYLRVGGNGNTVQGCNSCLWASVVATDGNLHLDAGVGKGLYLNFYDGSYIYFGNGANGNVGCVTSACLYHCAVICGTNLRAAGNMCTPLLYLTGVNTPIICGPAGHFVISTDSNCSMVGTTYSTRCFAFNGSCFKQTCELINSNCVQSPVLCATSYLQTPSICSPATVCVNAKCYNACDVIVGSSNAYACTAAVCDWYILGCVNESNSPQYWNIKTAAHNTLAFNVTTGYHGSNVAAIVVLNQTTTHNSGYLGVRCLRVVKPTSGGQYEVQALLCRPNVCCCGTLYISVCAGNNTYCHGSSMCPPVLPSSLCVGDAGCVVMSSVYTGGTGFSTGCNIWSENLICAPKVCGTCCVRGACLHSTGSICGTEICSGGWLRTCAINTGLWNACTLMHAYSISCEIFRLFPGCSNTVALQGYTCGASRGCISWNCFNQIHMHDMNGNVRFLVNAATDIRLCNATCIYGTLVTTGKATFSATESINFSGARGTFGGEFMHLYRSVGIGHPGGWGCGSAQTPQGGLSTYGGICIGYGCGVATPQTFRGKNMCIGCSSSWDNGSLNGTNTTITNVHFQGHTDFWIGAGNATWWTTASTGHHDLLINTMRSDATYTRGITFTATCAGTQTYRLGRWRSMCCSATSALLVDGKLGVGLNGANTLPPESLMVCGSARFICSTGGNWIFMGTTEGAVDVGLQRAGGQDLRFYTYSGGWNQAFRILGTSTYACTCLQSPVLCATSCVKGCRGEFGGNSHTCESGQAVIRMANSTDNHNYIVSNSAGYQSWTQWVTYTGGKNTWRIGTYDCADNTTSWSGCSVWRLAGRNHPGCGEINYIVLGSAGAWGCSCRVTFYCPYYRDGVSWCGDGNHYPIGAGGVVCGTSCVRGACLHSTGNICGTEICSSGWFRTTGSGGIYFTSYGGGWHMTDGTWIRSYNNKCVYINCTLRVDGLLHSLYTGAFAKETCGDKRLSVYTCGNMTANADGWCATAEICSVHDAHSLYIKHTPTGYWGVGMNTCGYGISVNQCSGASNARPAFMVCSGGAQRACIRFDGAINTSCCVCSPVICGTSSVRSSCFLGCITSSGNGASNTPFRLASDYNSWMIGAAPGAGCACATWGLFWAGNSGAAFGTNGACGPGNIWGNSGNPNEFVFVGANQTDWAVWGACGKTWQRNGATICCYACTCQFKTNDILSVGAACCQNCTGSGYVIGKHAVIPGTGWSYSGSSTGRVEIGLPTLNGEGGSTHLGMVHVVVDVYEYNNNGATTYVIGGHNWNCGWYNCTANRAAGCNPKGIKLAYHACGGTNNGRYVILIGEPGDTWSYGSVHVRRISNGLYYCSNMDMGTDMYIKQVTCADSWYNCTTSELTAQGTNRVGNLCAGTIYSTVNCSCVLCGWCCTCGAIICGTSLVKGNEICASNWFRNQTCGKGLYNSNSCSHFYAAGANYWHINSNCTVTNGGLVFYSAYNSTQGHATNRRGFIYWDGTNNFGLLTCGGNWSFRQEGENCTVLPYFTCFNGGIQVGSNATLQHINWTSGGDSGCPNANYSFFRGAGAWSHPYPDLVVNYHTGIRFGAYYGYGGFRFFCNSDCAGVACGCCTAGLLFSIGQFDGHTRAFGDLYGCTCVQSPVLCGTSCLRAPTVCATGCVTAPTVYSNGANMTQVARGCCRWCYFMVCGCECYFYPVCYYRGDGYGYKRFSINRSYSSTAPNTWNTSTHKGGLNYTWEQTSDTQWGGNDRSVRVKQVTQTYSTQFGGHVHTVSGGIVLLRGGGAIYCFFSDSGCCNTVCVYDGIGGTDCQGQGHSTCTYFVPGNGACVCTLTSIADAQSCANSTVCNSLVWPIRTAGVGNGSQSSACFSTVYGNSCVCASVLCSTGCLYANGILCSGNGITGNSYVRTPNYLQFGTILYPWSTSQNCVRHAIGNAAGSGWIDAMLICKGGNVEFPISGYNVVKCCGNIIACQGSVIAMPNSFSAFHTPFCAEYGYNAVGTAAWRLYIGGSYSMQQGYGCDGCTGYLLYAYAGGGGGKFKVYNGSNACSVTICGQTGAVCATCFVGDGSNLTGVGGGTETSCTHSSYSGTTGITLDITHKTHVLPLASGAVITGFTYSNRSSSGTVDTITLVVKYSGTASITWTNVVWSGGVTPTLTGTSGKADVFVLTSYNGSYWVGTIAATNLDSTNL